MLKIAFLVSLLAVQAQAQLTLYTDRPTARMQVVTDAFTEQTGVSVEIVEKGWADLKAQLQAEGDSTPADVILVKDLVYLNELVQMQSLRPLESTVAKELVDPAMQSELWTAITYRARTLIYHPSVDVSGIQTYADLAKPEYQGMLCLRTSKSAYNEALVADLITTYGYDETATILDGWLNNMVDITKIYPNDNTIIDEVAASQEVTFPTCQLGMVNSYYLGLKMVENPNIPVRLKFLSLGDSGSHTNGIGAGIARTSDQIEASRQFVEFLLSQEMQQYLSTAHQDFPANRQVAFPEVIQAWSNPPLNQTPWSQLTNSIEEARRLFEELDYQ